MTKEVFGVTAKDHQPIILAAEGETSVQLSMGHMTCTLGAESLRVFAGRLVQLAERIESRTK